MRESVSELLAGRRWAGRIDLQPRNVALVPTVAFFIGVALFGLLVRGTPPITAKLLHIEPFPSRGSKAVTVEFAMSPSKRIILESDFKVQLRVANRWETPQRADFNLFTETNRQSLVFLVPSDAQACRFLADYYVYREGARPYCRAYFFLASHGLLKSCPKVSRLVLACFRERLRHAVVDLPLS